MHNFRLQLASWIRHFPGLLALRPSQDLRLPTWLSTLVFWLVHGVWGFSLLTFGVVSGLLRLFLVYGLLAVLIVVPTPILTAESTQWIVQHALRLIQGIARLIFCLCWVSCFFVRECLCVSIRCGILAPRLV